MDSPPVSTFVANDLSTPLPTEKQLFLVYEEQLKVYEWDINTNCETGNWSQAFCVGIVVGKNLLRLLGYGRAFETTSEIHSANSITACNFFGS
jgi:hypothetical protein